MSLLRKGILTTSGSIFCAVLGVVTQMILARKLMPEGMGQYQVLLNSGTLVAAFVGLGVGQANIYFLNRIKINTVCITMNSLYWWFISGLGLIIVLFIIVKTFVSYFGYLPSFAVLVFAAGVSAILLASLLRPILVAGLRMKEVVAVSIALPAVYLVLVIFLVVFKRLQVATAIIAIAAGHIISVLILLWCLRKNIDLKYSFDFGLFGRTLAYGIKLFISNITLIASMSVGLLLLRYIMIEDFSQVGYFGRAMAICGLTRLITSSVTPMLYAKWSSASSVERTAQVERALRMQVALGIMIMVVILLFGRIIVTVLYGKAFLPAVAPMYILVFGLIFFSMTSIYSNLFAGDGKPLLNALIFGISIPFVVIIMFVLTPRFGIVGAAWAQTISSLIGLSLAVVITSRMYGVKLKSSLILNRSDIDYIRNSLFKRRESIEGREDVR